MTMDHGDSALAAYVANRIADAFRASATKDIRQKDIEKIPALPRDGGISSRVHHLQRVGRRRHGAEEDRLLDMEQMI